MKVLALLLIAAVLCSTLAIKAKTPSLAMKHKIDKHLASKSWSSIFLKLALLQSKAENPLEPLIGALNKLIADVNEKSDKATSDFDKRTGEHHSEVKRLNNEIDNANTDVAHTDSFLKEVLRPMKVGLEEDIAKLQAEIAKNRIFLEEAAM
jgi:peptidoglycan hydrolase CwlO-like protein